MPHNFVFIFLLFTLHTVCLSFLCPARFGIKRRVLIWGSVTILSTLTAFGLLKTLPLVTGAYISAVITIIPSVVTIFYMSCYSIPKTLFLFLTYVQAFWVVLFFSGLLSSMFFNGMLIPAAIVRTVLHIGVALLCAALRHPFASGSQRIQGGWWPLNLVAVLFAVYLGYLAPRTYAQGINTFALISFVLLTSVIVTVYVVFFHTIRYMNEAANAKQAKLQSTFLLRQIESMQEAVVVTNRARHDMRHHNLLIAQYAEKGQNEELLQYLGEYEKAIDSHTEAVYCENLAANNILSAYVRQAKKHGIEVRLEIALEQDIAVHDIDLVVMLANIMENAIHGCIQSGKPDPFIELYIGRKAAKLIIYAKNTAGDGIVFENGVPIASRGESIGVSSILHSAALYGGEYDFQMKDGLFSCQLLLKAPRAAVK